jgi:hypothetical protein
LDTTELIALYGTPTAEPLPRRVEVGPLAIDLADGAVVGVRWHGAEVLRGIAYPVRDPNWLTHASTDLDVEIDQSGDRATYRRRFSTAEGAISGTFTCEIAAGGRLCAHVAFRAERDVSVNRAGFVVLHPIADEAGVALTVRHADGLEQHTRLPRLISPGQPVFDIGALSYTVPSASIDIRFEGDTFEMEDQRNWTDASFKTYCRPLRLPYPYAVPAGTAWEQTITLQLSGGGTAEPGGKTPAVPAMCAAGTESLPRIALAHEAGWGTPICPPPPGSALVLRVDLRQPGAAEWAVLEAAAAQVPAELEAILPDDPAALAAALDGLAAATPRSGAPFQSLTVLPAAYLASHQPDGTWPEGADPGHARAEALARFPGLSIGAGVLSNFTELNRLPRRPTDPAFITYGTTAIVHAADDRSVMQTLEALPQVHASAAALSGNVPLRLGLSAIGMRSNPYGRGCAPNPDLQRKPCAMVDPRQSGLFAAAFMVGVIAATEGSTIERVVLGALSGPFSLLNDDGSARPAWHVFKALCALSGSARRATQCGAGLASVAATGADGFTHLILANATQESRRSRLPAGSVGFVLNHRTSTYFTSPDAELPMSPLPQPELSLPPYAVLLARLPVGA